MQTGAERLLVPWEPGRCPSALEPHLDTQHGQLLNSGDAADEAAAGALGRWLKRCDPEQE